MTDFKTETYKTFDGHSISYKELGKGPLVLMLHGFSGNAEINYFASGIAPKVAEAGYRVVAPDLRGHGASQVPDIRQSWPADAVARDQIALMAHLGEDLHGIVGYSMGGISALRFHLLSRLGQRLILGGVGDTVADEWNTDRNTAFFSAIEEAIADADTPGAQAIKARAQATGGTLVGYRGALSSRTYTPADLLKTFAIPTLVLTGTEDLDNGSGAGLADIIPGARHESLTGNHITAVSDPRLPQAVIEFLSN